MKKRILSKWWLVCLLSVVSLTVSAQMKVGDEYPDFTLQSATYGNVSKADLQGKVTMVNLFATWCGPCQKELAEVESVLWPKYQSNPNFRLLVVGREHTEEQLKTYNEGKHFTFPLYPDPDRKFYANFAENTIPRVYLFNKEGKLIYASIGYTPEKFEQLMKLIDEAL